MHDFHVNHPEIPMDVTAVDATRNHATNHDCKPLSEEERQRKVRFLRDQLLEYETPHERLWEMVVGQPSLNAAVKISLDINLFELWAEVCGGTLANQPLTLTELSWLVGCELGTMRRVLRHLSSYGVIREVSTETETYIQTELSRAMCDPSYTCRDLVLVRSLCPSSFGYADVRSASQFVVSSGWSFQISCEQLITNPRAIRGGGLFQKQKGCDETVFEYHEKIENKAEAEIFNKFVASYRTTRTPWTLVYDTAQIIEGYESGPLLVDIGGSRGDDLQCFNLAHPGNEAQLFLEDMPTVLETATCDPLIRRIPHNFFEPQPIKGARAYYLHSILHDWNREEDVIKILRHIRDAMTPGYSKILVNDIMMPGRGATRLQTSVDMQMWVMASARERTEDEFGQIFVKAGLETVKIWRNPMSVTSVFELAVRSV